MSEPVCPDCGGNCAPECGMHPAGCIFGGPPGAEFWLIAPGCELEHDDGRERVTVGE